MGILIRIKTSVVFCEWGRPLFSKGPRGPVRSFRFRGRRAPIFGSRSRLGPVGRHGIVGSCSGSALVVPPALISGRARGRPGRGITNSDSVVRAGLNWSRGLRFVSGPHHLGWVSRLSCVPPGAFEIRKPPRWCCGITSILLSKSASPQLQIARETR